MSRLMLLVFAAAALHAQNPADLFNKPPADVDEALRARITAFYQFHVTQQFRLAEPLVAEDTKDLFYSANKPKYLSFEITHIEYSDNFTRAKAMLTTERYLMLPGFGQKPVKFPTPSLWKLENGKWCWYVEPDSMNETPFGQFSSAPSASTVPKGGGIPAVIPTSIDFILNKVKTDKHSVTLKTGETTQVKFTNTAQGVMDLKVFETLPGVVAKLDNTHLKADGSALLTIVAGKNPQSGAIRVQVEETGEKIEIHVVIE